MTPGQARRLAAARRDLNAFVHLPEETDGDELFAVAVKDVIDVAGMPTSCGTSAIPSYLPEQDATVVAAIRSAGGGVVGKANLHEWAIGLTSANPSFGRVGNPRYPALIAGGSSGGSAAAVAAGLCDWALGTDTGGSIRVPAAACGVVGFKPTLGLLSNDGVVQVSETLDTVGPLASNVAEVQKAFGVLVGEPREIGFGKAVLVKPPSEWLGDLDPAVDEVWQQLSARLDEVRLPDREALTSASWIVLAFEAHRFHVRRLRESPGVFSDDVRAVLDSGAKISQNQYSEALAHLAEDAAACDEALGQNCVLMLPATAAEVPDVDSVASREPLTRFTRPFNGTGQPALCMPAPATRVPVGVQLVARRGMDEWLLHVGSTVERAWEEDR